MTFLADGISTGFSYQWKSTHADSCEGIENNDGSDAVRKSYPLNSMTLLSRAFPRMSGTSRSHLTLRHAALLPSVPTVVDTHYLNTWSEFCVHLSHSDLHLARQIANSIISDLTKPERRDEPPSDSVIALILPQLLSFLAPSLPRDFLPSVLALLFFFARLSLPTFTSLSPYSHLTTFYSEFPADLQSKQRLQSIICLLIPSLPTDCHSDALSFLLDSRPGFADWRRQAALINVLLSSLTELCEAMEESLLLTALPEVSVAIDECRKADRMFVFYARVADFAHAMARRRVDLSSLNRPLFDQLISTLGESRCQPHTPVVAMLTQHLYHFGLRGIGAVSIDQLLALLEMGARDGEGCTEILVLLATLVAEDCAAIGVLCQGAPLGLFSRLISEKEYRVKQSAMWLCWNIASLGRRDDLVRLLGAPGIAEALVDSLESTEDGFLAGLVVPTIAALIEDRAAPGIAPFLDALLEKAAEVAGFGGEAPALLPLLARYGSGEP
jgi:hypothetical protein